MYFFRVRIELKKKKKRGFEWKKQVTWVATLQIVWNDHFSPLSFNLPVPIIFKYYIFIPYFIFLFFSPLVEEREAVDGFQLKERKLWLATILTTKTMYFCVKWFYITRRVKIKCFLTLKYLKNIFELWKFFGF